MRQKGKVFSINLGGTKGVAKKAVKAARLIEGFGLEGDAHGGKDMRQISLLAIEGIRKQAACPKVEKNKLRPKGDNSFDPGDFDENITTEGLDLAQLKIGDRLKMGTEVLLEISMIGKECHKYCAMYETLGDCIMPREGVFARVLKSGNINIADSIEGCIK